MAHVQYKGTGQTHSFRGLLADGKQDRIRIEGATGEIAWRITKFQVMSNAPKSSDHVGIIKVWRESQATAAITATTINFNDDELLGCALWREGNALTETQTATIVFDNALFVRNIYVTATDADGNVGMNYYLELEKVKVSAAGMAQLAVGAARRNRFSSE